MAKRKPRPVVLPKKDDNVIHIDRRDIKVRKPLPPPVQVHKTKTAYRRKPRTPSQEE
jgi:hypothetical protein